MKLDRFSYYFSVKGSDGGVFSIRFEFLSDNAENFLTNLSKEMKNDFERLELILDSMFLTNLHIKKGEKTPTLKDTPSEVEAGFEYKGERRGKTHTILKYLSKMFLSTVFYSKSRRADLNRSLVSNLLSLSASLCCCVDKNTRTRVPPIFELEINAGYDLNLYMFEKVISLPELDISSQAEIEIQHLRQILAMGTQIDPKKYLLSTE